MITTPQQSKSDAEVAKTPDRYLKSKTPQRINHINKWSMEINPRSKEKKTSTEKRQWAKGSENQHGNQDLENQRVIGKGKLNQSNNKHCAKCPDRLAQVEVRISG